jgi:hypothetical protein
MEVVADCYDRGRPPVRCPLLTSLAGVLVAWLAAEAQNLPRVGPLSIGADPSQPID